MLVPCYMFRCFKAPSSGSFVWACWIVAQSRVRESINRMSAVYCDRLCDGWDVSQVNWCANTWTCDVFVCPLFVMAVVFIYFLWLCSPARSMVSCRRLWPPVVGYGLLSRAMVFCRGLWTPVAGYGLLSRAMASSSHEVSWSHTTTRQSR
jgi:hypothetical protein